MSDTCPACGSDIWKRQTRSHWNNSSPSTGCGLSASAWRVGRMDSCRTFVLIRAKTYRTLLTRCGISGAGLKRLSITLPITNMYLLQSDHFPSTSPKVPLTRRIPTLADVLDCLASDANGYEDAKHVGCHENCNPFYNWAREYGYDPDSRKAEKMFRTIKRQAEQLKRTLGQDAYEELLYNTERL